jgi:hypothetical protein
MAEALLFLGSLLFILTIAVFLETKYYEPKKQDKTHVESSYKQWKKRLQEEVEYSRVNPWRKEAKILRFPTERIKKDKK